MNKWFAFTLLLLGTVGIHLGIATAFRITAQRDVAEAQLRDAQKYDYWFTRAQTICENGMTNYSVFPDRLEVTCK